MSGWRDHFVTFGDRDAMFMDLNWWQPVLILIVALLAWQLFRRTNARNTKSSARNAPAPPKPASIFRWLLWLPPLAWAGFIFWLSDKSTPPDIGPEIPFKAKLGHYVLFTILAGLIAAPLGWTHRLPPARAATWALLLATAYGVTDEIHQAFVPYRTSMIADCATNALGAIFGAFVFYVYESLRRAKKNR